MKFFEKFLKFSQNFQTISAYRPNAQKLTHGLLNCFKKYAKIMRFCNFLKKFYENFRKYSHNFQIQK